MITITRLPELTPRHETEPIGFYGLRILAYILETGITCTLDAEQLQLADHMASTAVQAREILPGAVDKISAARHQIKRSLSVIAMLEHEAKMLALLNATDAETETETEQGSELEQLSKAERAVKLLRASLSLIVDQSSDDSDPSGRVPRVPRPIAPAPGDRLPIPGARIREDIF